MYVSDRGQVRLGLVVVEVADEVLDRVVREELAELASTAGRPASCCGRGPASASGTAGDGLGHREGLPGARHAQQRLVAQAAGEAVDQALDRLRLVAGGLERGDEAEVGHGSKTIHRRGQRGRTCVLFRGGACAPGTLVPTRRGRMTNVGLLRPRADAMLRRSAASPCQESADSARQREPHSTDEGRGRRRSDAGRVRARPADLHHPADGGRRVRLHVQQHPHRAVRVPPGRQRRGARSAARTAPTARSSRRSSRRSRRRSTTATSRPSRSSSPTATATRSPATQPLRADRHAGLSRDRHRPAVHPRPAARATRSRRAATRWPKAST